MEKKSPKHLEKKTKGKSAKASKIEKEEINEKEEISNEDVDEENSKELVETEEIDNQKLEKIDKEIKENKKKINEQKAKKYKKILANIIIAIIGTIYLDLLILGEQKIPMMEYMTDLKSFIVFYLIIAIFIFERALKKDSTTLALHGIEATVIGSATIWILDLFKKQNENIIKYISLMLIILVMYYLIKSIIIAFRKTK